jgi:hypothetical protein
MRKQFCPRTLSLLLLIFPLSYLTYAQSGNSDDSAVNHSALNNTINYLYANSKSVCTCLNGKEYIASPFSFSEGSPYFLAAEPGAGTLVYDHVFYDWCQLLYDELQNNLVLVDESHRIMLLNEKVARFSILGHQAGAKLKGPATVAGYIMDRSTGEPLAGASVIVEKTKIGTSTDQYGYYSISLPRGKYVLDIQNVGMKDTRRQILLNGDGKLNVDMQPTIIALRKVVVSAQKISNVKGTQMGFQKLDIKAIRQVPVVFGEADVLKVITTLPGVKTVGEASTGLNVRGGYGFWRYFEFCNL